MINFSNDSTSSFDAYAEIGKTRREREEERRRKRDASWLRRPIRPYGR